MVNKWVMVVDAELELLRLIDILLRRRQFAVIKAHSGALALHLVQSVKPDAFVLDMSLPDMDGIELCRVLRSTPHTVDIPVVMLASQDNGSLQRAAQAAGANEVLNKRVLPATLLKTLDGLLLPSPSSNGGNGHGGPC